MKNGKFVDDSEIVRGFVPIRDLKVMELETGDVWQDDNTSKSRGPGM